MICAFSKTYASSALLESRPMTLKPSCRWVCKVEPRYRLSLAEWPGMYKDSSCSEGGPGIVSHYSMEGCYQSFEL